MATITKAEIIQATFTRNLAEGHILDSDITLAYRKYVTAYINDTIDVESDLYNLYVKPVISFGVVVDIWNRIAYEITDRGMVQMQLQGTSLMDDTARLRLKAEYMNSLSTLIEIMVEKATELGMSVNEFDYGAIGYYGNERVGAL